MPVPVSQPEVQRSPYARLFNPDNPNYEMDSAYNVLFLKGQERYFNNLLRTRGHVFLNEVYDALGIDRSSAGQVVGWLHNPDDADSTGDNEICFGVIYDARLFTPGDPIALDFNVDGVMYEKI